MISAGKDEGNKENEKSITNIGQTLRVCLKS